MSGRVAHAYLLHGPKGVGKEKVAFLFAQTLNCTNMSNDGPCSSCDACLRIARGAHPDVRLVAPERELVSRGLVDAEKKRLPSEQIRITQLEELASLFRHRPYIGFWKVVVMIEADRMNLHCQNRFLKTLEEPTKDSVIILVTSHPESLLPTVRSRCQALSFGSVSREQISEYLRQQENIPEERAGVLACMAQGSLYRAMELAQGEALDVRDQVVEAMGVIRKSDLADLLEKADQLGQSRQWADVSLDLMEMWFRDLLFANTCVSTGLMVNQDRLDWIREQAEFYTTADLLGLIERIRVTRKDLKGYANPKMVMESVLLAARTS